jgi:hypothetical protein
MRRGAARRGAPCVSLCVYHGLMPPPRCYMQAWLDLAFAASLRQPPSALLSAAPVVTFVLAWQGHWVLHPLPSPSSSGPRGSSTLQRCCLLN